MPSLRSLWTWFAAYLLNYTFFKVTLFFNCFQGLLYLFTSYLNVNMHVFCIDIYYRWFSDVHKSWGVGTQSKSTVCLNNSTVIFSISYTPLLSVLSHIIQQQTITYQALCWLHSTLSFSALDFSRIITHLENTIANLSNWMSFNFFSPNTSKNGFLIFGLPQQLLTQNPTIYLPNNVILSPVESARNLGVIFHNVHNILHNIPLFVNLF